MLGQALSKNADDACANCGHRRDIHCSWWSSLEDDEPDSCYWQYVEDYCDCPGFRDIG